MDYSVGDIEIICLQLQQAQYRLAQNRTLINGLFNGDTPYTDEQAQEENVNTNVNFLEGSRIGMNATNQINRYFFGSDRFFSLRYDKGPIAQRNRVSDVCTKVVNKLMKRSRLYRSARESAHAQVVLHGPGALVWRNRRTPLPSTAGIEDVMVPQGTLCDMSNLDMFAIYREMTWGQLNDAAFGPAADPGWNKAYVKALLETLYKMGLQPIFQGNRWLFPEKLQEDYKEGATNTYSSAMPRVLAWDFFHINDDTGKWDRRTVLDYSSIAEDLGVKESEDVMQDKQLIYKRDGYADDWQEMIHWYIGNCSNVAPYRFHSIRSIGYLLFGVCALSNKMRCRFSDHMFQQLLTWFRNVSEDNREKLNLIDLGNMGIMPDGVSMVTAQERHVADWNLILGGLNQYRQLMAESSSSFVPDMQTALGSGGKELTATEALIRQNTSVTLTNAVLGQLGDYSLYEYMEIWRRFCMRSNPDPLAVKFREDLKKEGVPLEVLDYDCWQVLPETVVGSGNKASELTVTQALVQEIYGLVGPEAQRIILRRRYTALTDNPDEALAVVPEVPEVAAQDDAQYAQFAFTVLVQGLPFQDKEGADPAVMATTLMSLAQATMQQAQMVVGQPDGLAIAATKVAGVANVLAHVEEEVQRVTQGAQAVPTRKEQAKALGVQLKELQGALMQLGKEVQAAQEEQATAQPSGEEAELMAKLQDIQATGEVKRQIAGQQAEQKAMQRQAQWSEENQRRNADTAAEIERINARTMTELRNSAVKADAEAKIAVMKEAKKPAPKAAGGGK